MGTTSRSALRLGLAVGLAIGAASLATEGHETSASAQPRQGPPPARGRQRRPPPPRGPRITASCDAADWADAPEEAEADADWLAEATRVTAMPAPRALGELSRHIEAVDAVRAAAVGAPDPLGTQSYMLLLAHLRRGVRQAAMMRVDRNVVTREGRLVQNATRGQVERIGAARDPALAPLLVDALAQPLVAETALDALARLGEPVWARGIEPLLASPDLGAHAAAAIGELAPDPGAVYLRAIAAHAISPGGLGWMWRGYERTPSSTRKTLVGELVHTMLHDDREIGEVDTTSNRARTVSDRALDDLPTLVGVALARPRTDAERLALITAWETWRTACEHSRGAR